MYKQRRSPLKRRKRSKRRSPLKRRKRSKRRSPSKSRRRSKRRSPSKSRGRSKRRSPVKRRKRSKRSPSKRRQFDNGILDSIKRYVYGSPAPPPPPPLSRYALRELNTIPFEDIQKELELAGWELQKEFLGSGSQGSVWVGCKKGDRRRLCPYAVKIQLNDDIFENEYDIYKEFNDKPDAPLPKMYDTFIVGDYGVLIVDRLENCRPEKTDVLDIAEYFYNNGYLAYDLQLNNLMCDIYGNVKVVDTGEFEKIKGNKEKKYKEIVDYIENYLFMYV